MQLYVMPGACSLASHIALAWAGAPYKVEVLTHADAGGDAYRRINPRGAVPALKLDDGGVLTQSLAVLQYIADRFPDANLGAGPRDIMERARLNEALSDLASDVHKAWAPVFAPHRYVTGHANEEDVRQAAFGQIDLQYRRLDALMKNRQWMLFDRRTVADAYLYVMCRWKDKSPLPLANYAALASFKSPLDDDPGIRRALAEELTNE